MKRGRGSVTFVIGLVIYALLWLARNRGCEITSPLSCPIQ